MSLAGHHCPRRRVRGRAGPVDGDAPGVGKSVSVGILPTAHVGTSCQSCGTDPTEVVKLLFSCQNVEERPAGGGHDRESGGARSPTSQGEAGVSR